MFRRTILLGRNPRFTSGKKDSGDYFSTCIRHIRRNFSSGKTAAPRSEAMYAPCRADLVGLRKTLLVIFGRPFACLPSPRGVTHLSIRTV